jgi:glycosyltransferase involved in cell wall biosynthesis
LPIFEEDIEAQKENVREYLAAVELLQAIKKRKQWETSGFRATYLLLLVMILYFVFVGRPLWPGAATMYYVWLRQAGVATAGAAIFMTWAALQTFLPLLGTRFEREIDNVEARDTSETALVIPAYKAAMVLPATIEAALRIFKPEQIFVINNGNTLEPQDNTPEVCKKYGINHTWVPIGSKIVAEFIGVAFTSAYKYVLLIDDDVHLPANLPLVTHRLKGNTKCVGYTIKSTGADGIKGTLIQQCQDMEYKVSGLTRTFAGKYGSATFPHGAIILWDREVLSELFNVHPGYVISEDWYFGHAARSSGYRIQFCSQVFVETETPPALFKNSAAARGGFGEMTLYKQRFGRWNYFFVFRIWEDTIYILFAWRLGWRELITKLFVMVEVYDSVMAFVRPFIIVITGLASWRLLLIMTLGTTSMYIGGFVLLNTWHLRQKKEMVAWKVLPMYMLMKLILLFVNSLSVYYGLYDYARYFSVRHPRVTENGPALQAAYQARLRSILVPLASRNGCSERNVVDQQAQIMEALTLAYGTVFNDTAIDEKVLDDSDDGSSVIGAG